MFLTCKTCNQILPLDVNNIISVMNIVNHTISHGISIADIIEKSCGCYYKIQHVQKKAGFFSSPNSLELTCLKCGDVSLLDKDASGFSLSPIAMHLLQHHDINSIITTIIKPFYTHGQ